MYTYIFMYEYIPAVLVQTAVSYACMISIGT